MVPGNRYLPIGDYALIGNCRTAALISSAGSIDWLCLPRFDSASVFGALLDIDNGGSFSIQPENTRLARRRYIGDTNVLETTFTTDSGILRIVDLMPVRGEKEKGESLQPEHELLRKIECVEGEVSIHVSYQPRPQYGIAKPKLEDRNRFGILYQHRGSVLVLFSDIPLQLDEHRSSAHGQDLLRKGNRRYCSLTFAETEPAVILPLGDEAENRIQQSLDWWTSWSSRGRYSGPYPDVVKRSALVLKLLTFAPSGAVIAAPTTSLPEKIGGVRNWDYRYCWLRDASLTLRCLMELGYSEEAEAFMGWMLHATRLTQPELQILYDVFGERRLKERELHHLEGYAGSRPVRIGNDAKDQLQLDVYGEVVLAAFEYLQRGGRLNKSEANFLIGLGNVVCKRWREPDEGIWESRGGRLHHTYSKAMCWAALDRLIRLNDSGHLKVSRSKFDREREAIRLDIEQRGYSKELQSYVSVFDSKDLDASLLLLPKSGYADPRSTRMIATYAKLQEELGTNGLLYRYISDRDGLPPGEGAFGLCSTWALQCQIQAGKIKQAEKQFEHFLSFANDVGLFAEEIDPESGAALGNFPQAFTHVGIIDVSLSLARAGSARGG